VLAVTRAALADGTIAGEVTNRGDFGAVGFEVFVICFDPAGAINDWSETLVIEAAPGASVPFEIIVGACDSFLVAAGWAL
jgi:hypothetical protein